MRAGERAVKAADGFYDRIRHPDAQRAAEHGADTRGFDALRGHKYCLLVTYRRSGQPVPTPVWFGLDDTGAVLYVRTEGGAGKVKRIRANPRVLVGPASARGKPAGPLAEGRARVLPASEVERAERVLQANYGLGRRLYEGMSGPLGVDTVYLEVTSDVA
jgi:uncharacterized protein